MAVSFQNPGEIDFDAATTFGVSIKRGENPIGFFGTGLKYAAAVILRNGGSITIHAGGKSRRFGIKQKIISGVPQDIITLGGRQLGWTTQVGKNWEAWQAFRELYCNALDEGGDVHTGALKARPGYTTIVVKGWEAFEKAYEERGSYFLTDPPDVGKLGPLNVHTGSTNVIYYRGIAVGTIEPKPSMFTYNITDYVELTEDRTMKSPFMLAYKLMTAVALSSDRDFIREFLTADFGYLEANLNFDHCPVAPLEPFLEVASELKAGPQSGLLNKSVAENLTKWRPEAGINEAMTLTPRQAEDLERALAILEKRFPDVRDFPLTPVRSLGRGVRGLARKGRMYISKLAFEGGFLMLLGTVFEEYSHVSKDFVDESRDFQNYLIDYIARLLEEAHD